ncbi:hypothetical protein pipiens_012248, partial [Culex pipiens pipiens]
QPHVHEHGEALQEGHIRLDHLKPQLGLDGFNAFKRFRDAHERMHRRDARVGVHPPDDLLVDDFDVVVACTNMQLPLPVKSIVDNCDTTNSHRFFNAKFMLAVEVILENDGRVLIPKPIPF